MVEQAKQVSARAWPARTGPNPPDGQEPIDKVRQLQRRLWTAAKRSLRGWGSYFCTGNASKKLVQVYEYVWRRLRRFMVRRHGRNLTAGRADAWTRDFFVETHGLYRLRGTIRYPGAA